MKRILITALVAGLPAAAHAQTGDDFNWTGSYISVFGGYVGQDGPSVAGHADTAMAVEDGGFGGGTFGFVLPPEHSILGHRDLRVEASFAYGSFANDRASTFQGFIADLHGLSSVNSFGRNTTSTQERQVYDGSIALKGRWANSPGSSLTHALELFIRASEDQTKSSTGLEVPFRTADIDSWFYGALFGVQPELRLGPRISLVGDFGVGGYFTQGEGDFETSTGAPPISIADTSSAFGFRGRAIGGVKMAFADDLTATLFGGIDYWSKTPHARMPSLTGPDFSSHVALDDLLEFKGGLRLTYALSNQVQSRGH